jgi:hypothetical protein
VNESTISLVMGSVLRSTSCTSRQSLTGESTAWAREDQRTSQRTSPFASTSRTLTFVRLRFDTNASELPSPSPFSRVFPDLMSGGLFFRCDGTVSDRLRAGGSTFALQKSPASCTLQLMSPRTGRPRVFRESRNLIIRVEAELHDRLDEVAAERGATVSELVRPLLERLVRRKPKGGAK